MLFIDMKKLLLFLVAVLAMTMTLNARVVLIDEGFENGIQEDVWTQECVTGQMFWAVEDEADGLNHPSSVVQGSKRAYLRNNTSETLGYQTRLISKVMDLRPTQVYLPELSFYYANPKWGADRDTLRVLYRTSERGAWNLLAEYSNSTADWQFVKLSLPGVTKTYQIAFEGKDNLGRGIVLDSIKLQSAPECSIPEDILVTNKGAGRVNISWSMTYDAFFYELLVTKDTIDPYTIDEVEATTPEKIVYHGNVYGESSYDLPLEPGEFYLVYVRSNCGEEISAWSSEASKDGPYGFHVRTTKQVPFTEKFNYAKGTVRDSEWTWKSNTGNTNPYVNLATVGDARAKYSPDTTAALIFSGGSTIQPEVVLKADRYAYVATPALTDTTNANFHVNQCQVHFWSTVYSYTGRQYGRGIIVGVMEDPDDIGTFVPVDTVTVWGNMSFVESIVDLGGYNGNGSYLAFLSMFDRDNLFYLDNLTVEYRKDVNKVTDITVNPRDTYADITWNGNASSYNVLVTNAEVNPANPRADAIVHQATVQTNRYHCEGLEPNHSWNRPYYVYVQAAGQEWSYRYPFVTVASQRAIPYNYDFEASTTSKYQIASTGTKQYAEGIGIFGNSGSYPSVEISSAKSYVGSGYLYLSQTGGKDGWITLPMVENLDSVQVKFYLSGYTTFDQAHASVGVMTNPMDINTYTKVADFHLNTTGYTRCYANFENYSGPDGVIAIVWEDVANMSKSTNNYIDEIVVEKLSDCVPPTNVELQIEPDSITVSWDESDLSDEWEFFLSRVALKESDRMNKTLDEIAAMYGVEVAQRLTWTQPGQTPQFGFGGLTPHANYYLYVRATCDLTWWTEVAFNTPCRDESFPYKETFESFADAATTIGCWQLADYMGVDYPRIYQAGSSTASNKTLELYSSGTTHRSIAILPTVEGNLSDMLLSFDVRTQSGTASSSGVLYIGTMEDITIQSSFMPFDTIEVSGSSFKKVRYILSNCNLAHDHIAITSGIGSLSMNSDVIVDNVELRDPSCIDAYDFVQKNYGPHSIDLAWSGRSENDQWLVKVLSKNVAIASVKNNTYDRSLEVVSDTLITGNSLSFGGLDAQKIYYFYVRVLCGDSTWVSTSAYTTCELLNPAKANKETFESYATGSGSVPACWTVGNCATSSTYMTDSYKPYVYSSSTYASSGTNVLRLNEESSYGPVWAASPEIQCDTMTSLIVSFSFYCSTSYWGVFGVMTDPTNIRTFVPIDSVQGSASKVPMSYDLSEYASIIPATAKYFAWRGRYGAGDLFYIDDVSFISNACPMPKPSISDLTTSSVRVSSGLRTSDDWILLVTNTPISDAALEEGDLNIPESQIIYLDTLDRRSQIVTGLDGQTKYYVYTATVCDAVTKSQWSQLNFTTPCQAFTPEAMGTITFAEKDGFTTGTSGEMPCWTKGSKTRTASTTYQPYVTNNSSYQHNENNYLYFYDYVSGTSTVNVGAYAIMPALDVDSITKYQVNFWGRGSSTATSHSQIIVGVITDPSDLNTFVPVDTLNLSHSAWDPFSVGFEKYDGDYMGEMGTNIMFLSDFGVTNYAYISEISVELIPLCRPVSSFTVDSVGENSAVVSWKGYQDSYRLLVADKTLTEAQKPKYHYLVDSIVDHSDEVRINNLEPATNYVVYAQGICGDGDSTAISMTYASFRTECPTETGAPLPFYEDFEAYSTGHASPGCWTFYSSNSTTYPQLSVTSSTGTKAVELYTTSSNNSWMVMPAIDGDLYNAALSFDVSAWSSSFKGTLYVGTMADPADPTTFVLIASFPGQETSFTHHTIELADYDLPYNNIAFTSGFYSAMGLTSSSDIYVDNIALEYLATCNSPRLRFVGSSFNSLSIALTPAMKTDTLWEVVTISEAEYSLIGDITSYLESAQKQTVNTTSFVVNGLQQATSYYIYARTICGAEEKSTWTRNPLKVSTLFYYGDSYFFGFEKSGEHAELWEHSKYSESDNYYLHPALVTGRDAEEEIPSLFYYPFGRENYTDSIYYSKTDAGALNMYADGGIYGGYIIFPALEEPKDRSFEFKARSGYLVMNGNSRMPKQSVNAVLELGTVDKNQGFDTYQPMATIRLNALDPTQAATSKKNWKYSNYSLNLDAATVANKQMVLRLPEQSADTVYICIDDVKMGETKTFSMVAINSIVADGTSALVEWANIGGPWNLTIKNASGQIIQQFSNLTATSQLVENLEPLTDYTALLEAVQVAGKGSYDVVSDQLAFRTQCLTLEPNVNGTDFVWNFDNAYDWEPNNILGGDAYDSLYYKPACFNVGVTYRKPVNGYQWLVQRKGYEYIGAMSGYSSNYSHIEVGRNDSRSLRINTAGNATNSIFNSYIVLPELNCNFNEMMIEFYGRCFVNMDDTYSTISSRGKITTTAFLGSDFSQSIVVGTLTDPNDFSTLQVIDTLTYSHTDLTTTTDVRNDPAGLRYWELMQLPLDNAQGKYIVLFQPAPGLFFLDDLSVKPMGNTLFKPKNPHTTDITSTSVTMEWGVYQPDMASVVVLLDINGQEIFRDTIIGTQYRATGLQPAKNYQWYVYQTDGTNASPATKPIEFATECVAITPAYTCGFEPEEGWKHIEGQANVTQTLCLTYSDALQGEWASATYDPYNQTNTTDYAYAYDGSNALVMRATSGSRQSYQAYIALPAMDVTAYDTLQVMFWMRPAYVSAKNDSVIQSYTGSTYSKSVIVGTMTDPTNPATFMSLDTVTYDGTLSVADKATVENDYLFQQMKVELVGATGPYVALMTSFKEKGGTAQKASDYVWIDNISFEHKQECKDPTDLEALQIGSVHAVLHWNGIDSAGSYLLQVSTDPYFVDEDAFIFNEEVNSNTWKVEHLEPQTSYVWRVQALCGEKWGESSFSQKATFKTSRSPYFLEEFNTAVNNNEWLFSKGHAANILDKNVALSRGNDSWGFVRTNKNYGLNTSHYVSVGYNNDYHWIVTPNLFLPDEDSVHFSMDLALTACNVAHSETPNPVTENDMKDDYYLMIIISDDGGATWKSENILAKWQNTNPEGKQLRDIPATGMRVRYSLAPFAGKNVRIGIYREAITTGSTGIAVHVDNVRFGYFDKTVDNASTCQYEDVTVGDIHLSGDETTPGIHAYPIPFYATDEDAKAGVRDSVFQLEIEVFPAEETFLADTICEGESYTSYDFLPKTETGIYRRKLHTVEHGCDSIVTLNLYVKERRYAENEVIEICPGETYEWNGTIYNRAGIFRDTITSSIGCDSVMTLVIKNNTTLADTIRDNTTISPADLPFTYTNIEHPYAAGQQPIFYPIGTPEGTYVDTVFVVGAECADVLIHTLVIRVEEDIDHIFDGKGETRKLIYRDQMYIICNDEWYNALGQKVADPRK